MRCLDLETGRQIGEAQPTDSGSSRCLSLTAADGKLIILSGSGVLHIGDATPEGYREISRCDLYSDKRAPKKF
jgi:hypothetical protein